MVCTDLDHSKIIMVTRCKIFFWLFVYHFTLWKEILL